MDEELTVDPKYKQAYNNGYILAKHEPQLFKQIESSLDKDSPLLAGKQQYEKEKGAEKAKDYFKSFDRGDGKDRDKDKGPKR